MSSRLVDLLNEAGETLQTITLLRATTLENLLDRAGLDPDDYSNDMGALVSPGDQVTLVERQEETQAPAQAGNDGPKSVTVIKLGAEAKRVSARTVKEALEASGLDASNSSPFIGSAEVSGPDLTDPNLLQDGDQIMLAANVKGGNQ